MKVKFFLSMGFDSAHEEIVELPDDYTEDDIEAEYIEWRVGFLDGCWDIVEKDS